MLTEEALIVLAAFGALGLLILGVLELLWPTRPKHPVPRRPPVAPRAARPHRQSALARHTRDRAATPYVRRQAPLTPSPVPLAPLAPSVRALSPPPAEVVAEAIAPAPAEIVTAEPIAAPPAEIAAPEPLVLEPVATLSVDEVTLPMDEVTRPVVEVTRPVDEFTLPEVEPPSLEAEAPLIEAEAPPEPEMMPAIEVPAGEESVVEVCFALYQQQRYAEVIDRGAEAITGGPDGGPLIDAQETAALWSVIALARQALGEDSQARAALENAIAAAPDGDRPTYQRQLASLAESVAQGLLAEARRHPAPDSEDCLGMIRSAVAWLERGAAAAPDGHALRGLIGDALDMLWPAWQRAVMGLVQRQDFRGARRLLREALAEPRFPDARFETFKELLTGTFSGEIGQLTAQAIRSMQEARESDALASLQRAETLLDTLNDEALPPSRREEVDRRLWWGYNKLGARRVEAGEHEAALEALFHALGYEVGPARRQETVALLVRALDGVADARTLAVRELADTGDREGALVQCDKLWAFLRSATEMGLTQAELGATFARVQRLFESLGRSRGPA
jgi:tetratricopeptide (TPR) repeat protein